MSQLRMSIALALVSFVTLAMSSTKAAADNYGAIAYSQESDSIGYSYDYQEQSSAEERALQECGEGCAVVLWFRNACGALATGEGNGYGTAWATSRRAAEEAAVSTCSQYTQSCAVRQWVCTSR